MAAAVLLAAVAVLFLPAIGQPDALLYPTFSPHSDLTVIHWPKVRLMADGWHASGDLPLWTPANLSGMPLAGNQLAMRFYPPAWALLALPPDAVGIGFNLFFILHLWWGALGTYWLLRRGIGTARLPALIGGLVFALSGKLLAHMAGGHLSLVAAINWAPWAFVGLWLLLDEPAPPLRREGTTAGRRWRWSLLVGFALAMQLSTHSLALIYTAYLLFGYTTSEAIAGWRAGRRLTRSLVMALAAIPLIAVALGAAQLLSLVELAGYSNRSLSPAEAGLYALTPLSLVVALFLPATQGGPEMVIYLGWVPMVLAAVGLRGTPMPGLPRRRIWLLVAVVAVAAVYGLGATTPVFELAYTYLPGMHWVRTPARAFFIAALAISLLAGVGAERLARGGVAWSHRLALAVGATALLAGLGLAAVHAPNRATLGLALLPAAALVIAGLAVQRLPARRWAVPALAGLVCLDLLSFGATLIRFEAPAAAFAAGGEVAAYISRQPGLFRTYSPGYSVPPHVAVRAGLQTADGVEPVHLARYDRFMELAGGYGGALTTFTDRAGRFSVTVPPFPDDESLDDVWRAVEPDARRLGLLNVEYVVAPFAVVTSGLDLVAEVAGSYLYHNEYTLPRVWVLPESVAAPFLTAAIPHAVRGADAGPAWAEQLDALAAVSAEGVAAGSDAASVLDYRADRIVVAALLAGPGLLILSENWYPGWQAQVDGVPYEVVPVAGLLRGVALEAGQHTVVVEYRPGWATVGTGMSALAGLGLVIVVAVVQVRRRLF